MSSSNPIILVVGDNAQTRILLRNQLEKSGYQVLEATDATATLNILNTHKIVSIITDLRVPGIEGLDLLAFLTNRLPEVPVIVVSESSTDPISIEAVNLGAIEVVLLNQLNEKLPRIINKAMELHNLMVDNKLLRERINNQGPPKTYTGSLPIDTGWLTDKLLDAGLSLAEVERQLIIKALELHKGNQSRAARALGITRNTMIYRMRKYGISQAS